MDITKFNPKTNYEESAIQKSVYGNFKHIATSILVSAIEDADLEFFEDDYDKWKELRLKRKKKSEILVDIDLQNEFKYKQGYKETLFDIAEVTLSASNIPSEILEQRKLFESNQCKTLVKLTGYKMETIFNIAKLHGWKVGCDYKEKDIFDL